MHYANIEPAMPTTWERRSPVVEREIFEESDRLYCVDLGDRSLFHLLRLQSFLEVLSASCFSERNSDIYCLAQSAIERFLGF